MNEVPIPLHALVPGDACAELMLLEAPLSLWGGLDPSDGRIIDHRHPQSGRSVAGLLVVLPAVRGSSSSSSVLAEALRVGVGPAGIILGAPDGILVAGSLVARELYDVVCPMALIRPGHLEPALATFRRATQACLRVAEGSVTLTVATDGGVTTDPR
jgi:predicted aconitase with swiveling domain